MRMLLASVLVLGLGLSACGSSVEPDWTLQVTKVDRFAGCTPIAHLKNNSTATTNNIEVELTAGGMKHLAVFENLRPGQTQDLDLANLVTKNQPCSSFPADLKVAAAPHCLLGGKRLTAEKCLAGVKTEASMPSAVALAK
jgi:hypothetical protein